VSQQGHHDIVRGHDGMRVVAVVYHGMRYEIPESRSEHWLALEDYLASIRRPGIEALKEQFAALADSPALQAAMVECAYRDLRAPGADKITNDEIMHYANTRAGAIRLLHIKLASAYPEISHAMVEDMFRCCTDAEIARRVDESSRRQIQAAAVLQVGQEG
jgi:hypothetical protein